MNKHAYLIIAHNNFCILEKLLLLLDSQYNDFFIHIDKKVKNFEYKKISDKLRNSKIYYVTSMDVIWGAPSQIECEINLFKTALGNDKYSYYHLISGVDLPVKKADEIYSFFEQNKGKEFIGFCQDFDRSKIEQINLFNKIGRNKSILNSIKYRIRKYFIKIQKILNFNYMKKYNVTIKKGTNWASLTQECVEYIIENENLIKDMFKYSISGDEFYKQTLIWNSKFKENIFNINDEYESNMRLIDWDRGLPYTFKKEDFKLIMNSNKCFARKFDEDTDIDIVNMIYKKLQ